MDKTDSKVSIKDAMRLLQVKTEYALAKALDASPQTVAHWRKKRGGYLPPLWVDRLNLRRAS